MTMQTPLPPKVSNLFLSKNKRCAMFWSTYMQEQFFDFFYTFCSTKFIFSETLTSTWCSITSWLRAFNPKAPGAWGLSPRCRQRSPLRTGWFRGWSPPNTTFFSKKIFLLWFCSWLDRNVFQKILRKKIREFSFLFF